MKNFLTLLLLGILISPVFAQDELSGIQSELVEDWKRAKAYTLEYIEAMPDDKINFKATEEIRSFAEQMLHLSQGTIGLAGNATGKERIYQGENLEQSEQYKNKEALTKVVTDAYDFAIAAAGELDMSKANEIVARGQFNVTRLGWLKKAFEHQTHHRGQCTIYLRLAGVTPPQEKLF